MKPTALQPKFKKMGGLVPAIVQDATTKDVLMLAYMNRVAWLRTIKTRRAWLWSRERKQLWQKGESSGNVMIVRSIHYDCDRDAVLLLVAPAGPACHTGRRSCFYQTLSTKNKTGGTH